MKTPAQNAMNFVALDFETANAARSSPCALGIVVIENGAVSISKQWLIRPHDMRFDPFNIGIHNITPEMVQDKPEFDQLWPELEPYLSQYPVVAHNAAFDVSVLRKTLDSYGLKYPQTSYLCSVLLAKITWPGLASYRLDYMASHLGFELKHHDAASDANGAAAIVKASASIHNAVSFPDLISMTRIEIGTISSGSYKPCRLPEECRYNHRSHPKQEKAVWSEIAPTVENVSTDSTFTGKRVVFTGALVTMSRAKAAQEVVNRGGDCGDAINTDTDYLAAGSFTAATMHDGGKTAKLKKAVSLASEGRRLKSSAKKIS